MAKRFAPALQLALAISLTACAGRAQEVGGVALQRGATTRSLDTEALMRKAAAAVVIVETDVARGMGFVVDPSGYVITNRHVIEDADHIEHIVFPEANPPQRYSSVHVAYIDPVRDLALLKIEARQSFPRLRVATRKDAPIQDYLHRSDPVLLLQRDDSKPSSPKQDFKLVARAGTVRALKVRNPAAGPGPFVSLTTDVHQGQSGGPVLDRFGRVVGIVTWTWRNREGGYAIPISEATRMLTERPELADEKTQGERAEQRTRSFVDALRHGRIEDARRMTSPSYARQVRENTVRQILGADGPSDPAVLQGFVAALEEVAHEERAAGGDDFERLQELVWRTGSREFRRALGVEGSLHRTQVVSFFYEFGEAYLSARFYGGQDPQQALQSVFRRLQTVDAARTFALAELLETLASNEVEIERVGVVPGAYKPQATVELRIRAPRSSAPATSRRLTLNLRMEWGDWYVAEVGPEALADSSG